MPQEVVPEKSQRKRAPQPARPEPVEVVVVVAVAPPEPARELAPEATGELWERELA